MRQVRYKELLINSYFVLSEAEGSITTVLPNSYGTQDSSTSLRMTINQRYHK